MSKSDHGNDDSDNIPDEVFIPTEDFIDLHTFKPGDIRSVVDSYLQAASEAGFAVVRVIHGRGIGSQRRQVRKLLATHKLVSEFSDAPADRGGWGATVVRLRLDTSSTESSSR
jgi:DNA-nicking Smr family endonuclease